MRSLSFITLILITSCQGLSAAEFVLNTAAIEPFHTPQQTGLIDRLLQEVFKKAGHTVVIHSLPAERALIDANDDLADGEAFRVAGLASHYQNLIQLKHSIFTNEFSVFSRRQIALSQGWDSIRGYRIGIVKGHKILEHHTGNMNVYKARKPELLFRMLAKDRLDIVIISHYIGLHLVQKLNLPDIIVNQPPLLMLEMFVYMHKKHQWVIPQLESVIIQMKADGTDRQRVNGISDQGAALTH